jgi:putative flippase GtrA
MEKPVQRRTDIRQVLRYLVVGGWNTLFGYGLFAFFTHLLRHVPYGYLPALVAANVIAVSVAFLGYKWFVFRTAGNYLREWLKTMTVYGTGMLVNAALLAPLVGILHSYSRLGERAPYVGQAFLAVMVVVLSFLGHKHFTFRRREDLSVS